MPHTVTLGTLRELIAGGAVSGVSILGQHGGYVVVVALRMGERTLTAKRGGVRMFATIDSAMRTLREAGIVHAQIDTSHYAPGPWRSRPARPDSQGIHHVAGNPSTRKPAATADSAVLARFMDVFELAENVFGDRTKASDWLLRPPAHFAGVEDAPIHLLETSQGADLVRERLEQIRHGIFA